MNIGRWLRRLPGVRRSEAVVLMYHRFTDARPDPWSLGVSPAHFADHVALLRRAYHPCSLRQLARHLRDGHLPRRTVVVTADDGYVDNLQVAAPLLSAHEVPATFFLTTCGIDRMLPYWWDELATIVLGDHPLPAALPLPEGISWDGAQDADATWTADVPPQAARDRLFLSTWQALYRVEPAAQADAVATLRDAVRTAPPCAHGTLTSADVEALAGMPLFELGAHGRTHRPLDHQSAATLHHEVAGSCQHLAARCGRPVESFAFPHGAYDSNALDAVRRAGLSAACTTVAATTHTATNPLALPRIHVRDWSADRLDEALRWWLGG